MEDEIENVEDGDDDDDHDDDDDDDDDGGGGGESFRERFWKKSSQCRKLLLQVKIGNGVISLL